MPGLRVRSQRHYFYNPGTQKTLWELPSDRPSLEVSAVRPSSKPQMPTRRPAPSHVA